MFSLVAKVWFSNFPHKIVFARMPESDPDVPGFACLPEEEFEALCQQLGGDILKGLLVVFGNPSREDHIVIC